MASSIVKMMLFLFYVNMSDVFFRDNQMVVVQGATNIIDAMLIK